jgi:hypothetical protein
MAVCEPHHTIQAQQNNELNTAESRLHAGSCSLRINSLNQGGDIYWNWYQFTFAPLVKTT